MSLSDSSVHSIHVREESVNLKICGKKSQVQTEYRMKTN
jgi:hypothetical protein